MLGSGVADVVLVKLVSSDDAEPQALYPAGDQSFEFERTASHLME